MASRFRRQLPGARVVTTEGHHYVHNANGEQVAAEIRAFLDGVPPGR